MNTRGKNWLLCKGPIVFFLFIDGKDTQDHQRHNHSSNVTPTTISTSATQTNDQDTDPKITPPDDLPREHNGCVQDHNNETHLLLLMANYKGHPLCEFCGIPSHRSPSCKYRIRDVYNGITRDSHPARGTSISNGRMRLGYGTRGCGIFKAGIQN